MLSQLRVGQKRGVVELSPFATIQQERDPEPVRVEEISHLSRHVDSVGGRERLADSPHRRHAGIEPGGKTGEHVAHEGRMQERDISRGDKDTFAAALQGFQGHGKASERAHALLEVVEHLENCRENRQELAGRAHDNDRAVELAPMIPATRRTRVEPCQVKAALAEPMRDDRPPTRTTPPRLVIHVPDRS